MNALVETIENCIPGAGAVDSLPVNLRDANWNLRIMVAGRLTFTAKYCNVIQNVWNQNYQRARKS